MREVFIRGQAHREFMYMQRCLGIEELLVALWIRLEGQILCRHLNYYKLSIMLQPHEKVHVTVKNKLPR